MHQTDGSELLEMYLNSLTTSYDPHSDYMSPRTLKNFDIIMSLELEGIGASLMSEDGYTVVKKIIPKGAADKNGQLKVEDKIVGVGQGDNGEIVDVVDMKLNDVVDLIRGKRGTVVRLDVIPATGTEPKVIRIAREKIELTDSEAQGEIFDAGQKPDGTPYRVGVIDLPSFYMDMAGARRGLPDYKSTTRDVRNILDDFKKKGVDAVVLDLRWNGGGSLTEAINLTGLFITDGPVVQVKGADGRVEPYYDLDPSVSWAGPLVVVTSKFSASASEILAGAIQDYGRGLIVGDHSTHGKGTVQSLLELGQRLFGPNGPQMGALKITQQQFYRPCGDSTQKRGVLADVELPSLSSHLDVGEADLDYPLEFDKVDTLPFKRYGEANPALCGQLRELSEQRTKNSEWFQKELRKVARYEEQKKKKTVTLNEEKFLKERAELNADKEEEKSFEKLSNANNKGIVRDDYLNEVFTIVNDYLNQTSVSKAQQAAKGPSKP
jgi:carboxyl-terminal processing protease